LPGRVLDRCLQTVLITALLVLVGCSYLERLKVPLYGGVDKRVQHREVVRIGKKVYVKVPNPEARMDNPYERFLYVPLEEYLANRKTYDSLSSSFPGPENQRREPVKPTPPSPFPVEEMNQTGRLQARLHLRKRLLVAPFTDAAGSGPDGLSEILTERLISRIEAVSGEVVVIDGSAMAERLEENGVEGASFGSQEVIQLVRRLYNIHAILTGTIDYLFVSSTESLVKGGGKTAYAIAGVKARLIDTASAKVQGEWEERNPVFDSEGKGRFSDEKARLKAIDLIASDLASVVGEELRKIDWYTTIASVRGSRVYIPAGRLSGVEVGNVFSVFSGASPGDLKGEIRVAALFGIDASLAEVTMGEGFRTNDLVRPVFQ